MKFSYNRSTGLLSTITDKNGKRTSYSYNGNNELDEIAYSSGKKLELSYINGNIETVSSSDKIQTKLEYNLGRLENIVQKSLATSITKSGPLDTPSGEEVDLAHTIIDYTYNSSTKVATTTVKNVSPLNTSIILSQSRYTFDGNNNLTAKYVEEVGKVTSAEQYEFVPYYVGTTAQSNPRQVTKKAKESILRVSSLASFVFPTLSTQIDTSTTTLDQFNNALKTTTSAIDLTANGSNKQTTVVDYAYDDNQKVIQEKATITTTNPATTKVAFTNYMYNTQVNVVRKESYVEDELLDNGKNIEEFFYNDKGDKIKSVSYNSLDTSSKFYSESIVNEQGQTTAEFDTTGENKTEISYLDGTNTVVSQTLPNGSKFAYGYDIDDTVTAITQSTDEGEGNSNQTRYTSGLVTEVSSGNPTVGYEYDAKRRNTVIHLNDKQSYITAEYTDGSESNDDIAFVKYISRDGSNSDVYKTTTNKKGQVKAVRYGFVDKNATDITSTPILSYNYDSRDRLSSVTDSVASIAHSYTYDSLDRQLTHTFGNNTVSTEYNNYGDVGKNIVKFNNSDSDKLEYIYNHDPDSTRKLLSMGVANLVENYTFDLLGRTKKTTLETNGKLFSSQLGYYKQGDHATNRVNTISYGKNGNTDGKLTYTYDNMGNIVSVNENGKQIAKYSYDKIGRIVCEHDIDKNSTICYTYDNQGNILTKSVDGNITNYSYAEGTDRLTSFGSETFAYDNMGNPTTYRSKSATWVRGRSLASYDSNSFTYDAGGIRTSKTSSGITTNYIYEGSKLLRQSTGSETIDFIYGGSGIIGIKITDGTNAGTYIFRKNLFGDITQIYNQSGELVGKYSYTAFGKCNVELDTNGIATLNPIRYRGYYFDTSTNLYYLQSRYYDPVIGRFVTIDDTQYLAPNQINGLNLYAYCGSNPIMFTGRTGTNAWNDFWNGVGNFFTGVGNAIQSGWDWTVNNVFKPIGSFFSNPAVLKTLMIIGSGLEIIAGIALIATGVGGPLGMGLIAMGASSLIGGFLNEASGGSFLTGWVGGQISGLASMIPGLGAPIGAFLSSIYTQGMG